MQKNGGVRFGTPAGGSDGGYLRGPSFAVSRSGGLRRRGHSLGAAGRTEDDDGKDGGGNAGRRTGFSAEGEIKQAGRTDFSFRIYRRCGDRCPVSVISGGLCGRHCAVSEFRLVRSISGRGGSGISRRGNRRLCCTGGAASDDFSGADAEYQQNAGS